MKNQLNSKEGQDIKNNIFMTKNIAQVLKKKHGNILFFENILP